jgi:hypothetical protein
MNGKEPEGEVGLEEMVEWLEGKIRELESMVRAAEALSK